MAKWEYQTIVCLNEYNNTSVLNGMGEDGWELVSAVSMPSETIHYIFKRLKEE
jgi:hypothetical protein